MRSWDEVVGGDVAGVEWRVRVHRFEGTDPSAPGAYLQAALHGSEIPGVAALHYLMPMIAAAEAEGRLAGAVTVVPRANPIGAGQYLLGSHLGRFALGSRVNFNRDFPLLDRPDPALLPDDGAAISADRRLKALLLRLSLGHAIVLDLHCDDESPSYFYVQDVLWPGLADLAACLGSEAVLVWDTTSNGAFDEAAMRPYLAGLDSAAPARVVSTVEFRGEADVSPDLARSDAEGLYRFLVGRGVIVDPGVAPPPDWRGPAVPLANVEMVSSPVSGPLLYEARPGDRLRAGDPIASVLTDPGVEGGATQITAPQDGLMLTRLSARQVRRGDGIAKLLCERPSEKPKRPGTLEE